MYRDAHTVTPIELDSIEFSQWEEDVTVGFEDLRVTNVELLVFENDLESE